MQRASPALVVVGIAAAKKLATGRYLICCGLVKTQTAHIEEAGGCLAATDHAAGLVLEEQVLPVQHCLNFLEA